MRTFLGGLLGLTLLSLVGTQVLAYQAHYSPVLGVPLARCYVFAHHLSLYRPWEGYRWVWQWGRGMARDTLGLAALSGLGAGCLGFLLMTPRRRGRRGEAHWATTRELRQADCLAKTGVVLGKQRRTILRYRGQGHLLVIAGTQTGKTASIVKPTLLEDPRSIICHDAKLDLYPTTSGYRRRLGPVWHLAPLSEKTTRFNPLSMIRLGTDDEVRDVDLITQYLLEQAISLVQDETGLHFRELVTQFLRGLLLYGLTSGRGMTLGDAYDLVTLSDWDALLKALRTSGHGEVARAGQVTTAIAEKELSGLRTTAMRALSMFADPRVRHMTSASDSPLTMLREGAQPCTVYLAIPFTDQQRLLPLMRLLTSQLMDYCCSRLKGWRHPLLILLDELESLEALPWLPRLLNYAAEFGVQLCLLSPTYEGLVQTYGTHHNLLDSCRVQVYFGVHNPEVAQRIAQHIGMQTVTHRRKSTMRGRVSWTTEERQEPLMSATALLRLPAEEVVLIAGAATARVRQARFYQQRVWRRRHGGS